jgi:hypothetical protein
MAIVFVFLGVLVAMMAGAVGAGSIVARRRLSRALDVKGGSVLGLPSRAVYRDALIVGQEHRKPLRRTKPQGSKSDPMIGRTFFR